MPERRWRIKKSIILPGMWLVYQRDLDGLTVIPGSSRRFQTWGGAIGYVNLKVWMDRGGNPPPPVQYCEDE